MIHVNDISAFSQAHDVFMRIANEASNLRIINDRAGIDARDIQTACKLCIPGEV